VTRETQCEKGTDTIYNMVSRQAALKEIGKLVEMEIVKREG
jgi:hypothetical protein